ncbi:MAG: class I SAM-dependent methyltransferase [Clostridia bacterium]|nr:class I SAM-dependent methyltransferase [Clostridia bacterium]
MDKNRLKTIWKEEENLAHIKGWDFSHIDDRYESDRTLPWDYESIVKSYLKDDLDILDYDTGGGEFLLSLGHPFEHTCATEGYAPNVELCKEKLIPLGIDFKACDNPAKIPYEDEKFDLILNRHGSYDPAELYRLLKKGGVFITEQVGSKNDEDLVERVLPGTPSPFPDLYMEKQKEEFAKVGFEILEAQEVFSPIVFYDMGAFVWFARIIEWEFPQFSVDQCFDRLLTMEEEMKQEGKIQGTTHRFLLVLRK